MGTKFFKTCVFAICLIQSQYGFGQTESERKFVLNDIDSLSALLLNNKVLGPYGFYYHSDYYYLDLYFDTPEKLLQKHQLSLRMRIQNKPGEEDSLGYTFQLKSEMTIPGAPRLEIEETELDFYLIEHIGNTITLSQLLDLFFEEGKSETPNFHPFISSLSAWFKIKAGAPIAPFQGLRFLHPKIFSEKTIGTLTPVVYGSIKRSRVHVYLSEHSNLFIGVRNKVRSLGSLPGFFLHNRNLIWLMEASLDKALLMNIANTDKRCEIFELEIESKFDETSLKEGNVLAFFAETMMQKFKADEEVRSKFKQVMDCLGGQ